MIGHQMTAMLRRSAHVGRSARSASAASLPASAKLARPAGCARKIRLCLLRPHGLRGGRADGQPRRQALAAPLVERQARGNADHGNLHRLAPALLQNAVAGSVRQPRETNRGDDLRDPERRLSGAEDELTQGHGAISRRTGDVNVGVQHKQCRHEVGGRRGIDDVAADGGDVAHLMAADHARRLDEAYSSPWKAGCSSIAR